MKKKILAGVLACVLCIGVGIGGTLAWLTAETGEVKNTFTVGDINIDLKEHDYITEEDKPADSALLGTLNQNSEVSVNDDYYFVPGDTLPKDPFVTVEEGSEACWVFIKITENNNTATNLEGKIINWTVSSDWTPVANQTNLWYKEFSAIPQNNDNKDDGVETFILTNNVVTVNQDVTKAMVTEINDATKPELKFEAFAHQKDNTDLTTATAAAVAHFAS